MTEITKEQIIDVRSQLTANDNRLNPLYFEAMARIIGSWVEWAEKEHAGNKILITPESNLMAFPCAFWPGIVQLKLWVNSLRDANEGVETLQSQLTAANKQVKELQKLLNGRDEFNVEHGLWMDFVSVCHSYPRDGAEFLKDDMK